MANYYLDYECMRECVGNQHGCLNRSPAVAVFGCMRPVPPSPVQPSDSPHELIFVLLVISWAMFFVWYYKTADEPPRYDEVGTRRAFK